MDCNTVLPLPVHNAFVENELFPHLWAVPPCTLANDIYPHQYTVIYECSEKIWYPQEEFIVRDTVAQKTVLMFCYFRKTDLA